VVAQDIAHDPQVGPSVDLPGGVAMAENMGTNDLRRGSGAA
jgi:hypothetical protein